MEKSELTDLILRVTKNADEIAFSKLFDFLAPKINAYFIQNGLLNDIAEDLTQEVMSTLWTKSHLYNPSKSSISTWVYTIARNKKVDFHRKNVKVEKSEQDIREFLYKNNQTDMIAESDIKDQVEKISAELNNNQSKINCGRWQWSSNFRRR